MWLESRLCAGNLDALQILLQRRRSGSFIGLGYLRRLFRPIAFVIAAALCPDSKRGEDQLPALLVPAERGEVLFI